MSNLREVNITQSGLSKVDLYPIIFTAMSRNQDSLEMNEIHDAVNEKLAETQQILSEQGKKSINTLISKCAKEEGYVFSYSRNNWRLTDEGSDFIEDKEEQEGVDITGPDEVKMSNNRRGTLFEKYVLGLFTRIHPNYVWFRQGRLTQHERGLDLIAKPIGESTSQYKSIGIQVKHHINEKDTIPTDYWNKFLQGCFVRRIDEAIIVTTGKLTGEQYRDAGEANIKVIEGIGEIHRLSKMYDYKTFDEFLMEFDE